MLTANGPISVAAGGVIGLTMQSCDEARYTANGGNIVLEEGGAYYVALHADFPADSVVGTTLSLELDGRSQMPPEMVITASTTDGSTENYSGSGVIRAEAGSALQLITSEALSISTATAQPVFTLVLVKL